MAENPTPSQTLIAGRYAVDPSALMLEAGGGLTACVARDRQAADAARIAILVSRNASPRIEAIEALVDPIDNLMSPLGHGIAAAQGGKGEAYYIVCSPPPGAPLSAALRPWPERALIDNVLRPAARVLDTLQGLGLTHRAIRLNNVFQSVPGQPVTLGAAWAAPPAMHQPAVFESPYHALCHPAARGEGTIADDVYALGALLLALASGRVPMADSDDSGIIGAKLELGSFQAMSRGLPISGFLTDLLRGMLADDAEHRPPPALLLDPAAARARRIAARPARISQRPLMVNDVAAFESRTLAYALARDEKKAIQALRGDVITTWLRRGLGDALLASAVEELVRERLAQTRTGPRSDALLVMRCIAALNPRMPLCWRGVALWPDGLDGLLAEAISSGNELSAFVEELVSNDVVENWMSGPGGPAPKSRSAFTRELSEQRRLLQSQRPGAMLQLFYTRHPLLPCRIPSMATRWVLGMPNVLASLEQSVTSADGRIIDFHLAAFIAGRANSHTEGQINSLQSRQDPDAQRLGELGVFRELQVQYHPKPLPRLCKWVVSRVRPEIEKWQNRPKREAIAKRLDELADAGSIAAIMELVMDPSGRAADVQGARRAVGELTLVNAQLKSIDDDDRFRFAAIEQFGHAITGAIGLTALILVVLSLVAG